ncbi:hypothetical protein A6R68_12516 [Neotoma lepida]|uniref:GTP-eEF1A C-terminal domain-containing protein n=1 Tax=Neotoma lepida TaxID=56216 RepID=A0A1A6H4Z6_NEOLE|nr:hypothetical protein A6R68_12516 [Neotoma lepida]
MDLGSSSDSAPDCWDQVDMEAPGSAPSGDGIASAAEAAEAEAQRQHLSTAFSSQLNINAKPFVPSIVIIEHKSIICPGYNAVLHIHTCIEEVEITALISLVDKKSGEKSKTRPRFVKQDQVP